MSDKPENVVSLERARVLRQMGLEGGRALCTLDGDPDDIVGIVQDPEDLQCKMALLSPDGADGWVMTAAQAETLAELLMLYAYEAKRENARLTGGGTGLPIEIFGGKSADALRVVLVNAVAADMDPEEERR